LENIVSTAQALEQLLALQELTTSTGVMTNKTRNQILASLEPVVLAEVAVELKKRSMLSQYKSNTNRTPANASNRNIY
jgi:hypothetical protein